ncbi:hypothetical protein E4T52_03481 [Aureobasidium sp. EXF-3400]|nr:hypothetical protein E4T51_02670 [Aureobasidium sp. EXF-12344]KAI4781647.1 hypothetical protein E4T52_03481 [Aureobasidium sp. EXF-3400]
MVVLAASICTRGGKAVLSRQFREMQRSRIEALLASLPKLADSGTQHTTVEQDNVRFVYQPLDELYMVLITNRQSNILQDIDSLHLFAQVVTSICRSLDEREILRNAFELLSAFDELVTLGYRENLTLSQIKTFLDMESHEERIQDIISRNKELEATEERKRKAKQLEMQRKEATRSGRSNMPSAPSYPTYTPPPTQPAVTDTYDSYNAEKNKSFQKSLPARSKGMQLGKKTKTTSMFEQVRGDLGPEAEAPLVPSAPAASAPVQAAAPVVSSDREGLHITVAETISAKLSREGSLESFEVKGDLQLRITDPSLTQVQLALSLGETHGAQLNSHPKVDKAAFKNDKIIQLTDTSKGFPANNSIGVMRWRLAAKAEDISDPPITFTAWVNETGSGTYNITLEYELTGGDALNDVTVSIPYQTSEPSVSSFDAVYEVSGDSIDWTIGDVDDANATGSFEFEAQAESEAEFFPMSVRFSKTRPYVEVDVSSVTLLNMGQDISFSKDVKSTADGYMVVFKAYCGRYDMFATQAALDDYFDSMQRKDRLTADVMFVGHAGGRNRVTVDDILEIKYTPDFPGSGIESPMEEDDETPHSLVPLMYTSHRRSKYHALLRAERDDEATDGPNQGFKNLHISLFDIPLIFMENVNETLEEKGEGALEDNLYHLAMTGNFTPTMLEWLRDELAERGHKRWDHAMTTLYTELSKILHTNLLPVLERSMVVATNLRGLARYYSDTPHFDVPPEAFTSILSTLSSLQLLVHEAVQILGIEQRQFRAFSRWLRHQIDLAAADPESLSAKDMAERETPQLDLPNTLAYLEGGLTKSRLKPIVFSTSEVDASQQPTTKDLITSIHTSRTNLQDFETQTLLSLHLWSEHLNAVCKSAHQHISLWHQSSKPKTLDISCRTSTTASILPYLDILMLETSADVFETFVLDQQMENQATHGNKFCFPLPQLLHLQSQP